MTSVSREFTPWCQCAASIELSPLNMSVQREDNSQDDNGKCSNRTKRLYFCFVNLKKRSSHCLMTNESLILNV